MQLASVGKRDLAEERQRRAIAGLVAQQRNGLAVAELVSRQARAPKRGRGEGLDRPGGDLASCVGDVQIQVDVRVDPLHLGDDTFEGDRLALVELREERVVSEHRNRCHHQPGCRHHCPDSLVHRLHLSECDPLLKISYRETGVR
jgi:hypothetical protein